jgi:transketolase
VRAAFVQTLVELARRDERVVLLTGDLGFRALEPFRDAYPERFFNVGVAEQNMLGLAAGLAEAGYTPYCYSIATFATLRAVEFFRNGAVWHQLPVRLIGMGGGFEYGPAGFSHHALEDVGIMRLLPGVSVLAPADAGQTPPVIEHAQALPGPAYVRLGKDERRRVAGLDGSFDPSRAAVVRSGSTGLILAMGSIASEVRAAADDLATAFDIDTTVAIVACLAPIPTEHLVELISSHSWAATVEVHVRSGGLGAVVAETIVDSGCHRPLLRCCVENPLITDTTGSETYLNELHGLAGPGLRDRLRHFAKSCA